MRISFVFLILGSLAFAKDMPPLCNNLLRLVDPGDVRKLQIADKHDREYLITEALGPEKIAVLEKVLRRPIFAKIESEAEALAMLHAVLDDPTIYKPLIAVRQDLSADQDWALYLNSGFHAVSTYTEGHREMVMSAIDQFPKSAEDRPTRAIDVGLGNGNLMIAAAVADTKILMNGVDIAGPGLDITARRMNRIANIAAQKNNDPGLMNSGRFNVGRGNAADSHLLSGRKFDAASMVLTLFAVPPNLRKQVCRNIYDSLEPGSRFVLIDPVPKVNDPAAGRIFLEEIVKAAYRNNPELNVLDVAILAVKNGHGLLQISFNSPAEQKALVESVGFRAVSEPEAMYYGITSMQVFEKPK